MSVEDAWSELAALKNFRDELQFPQLSTLAACALSLPHSNADAERIFSIVTDVNTPKRNRMGIDSLNSIAVVRSAFASKNVTCKTCQETNAHLAKFNSSIYERS